MKTSLVSEERQKENQEGRGFEEGKKRGYNFRVVLLNPYLRRQYMTVKNND